MARTVIALFDEISDAHEAVRDLLEHGFDRENISLLVSNLQGTTLISPKSITLIKPPARLLKEQESALGSAR